LAVKKLAFAYELILVEATTFVKFIEQLCE